MSVDKPARAAFIEPRTPGSAGFYVAVHSEEPDQIFFLPRDRALGHFGVSREAAHWLWSMLGTFLRGEEIDESPTLVELRAEDGSPGFAERAEADFSLAAGEP
jgi:hypothetical protein